MLVACLAIQVLPHTARKPAMGTFVRSFYRTAQSLTEAAEFEGVAVRVGLNMSMVSRNADRRVCVGKHVKAIDTFDELVRTFFK